MAKPETRKRVLDKYQYENGLGIKSALKQISSPFESMEKIHVFLFVAY